ncbi:MAG: hypothetical protein FK734_15575, partial [Asgard group archaeon]|nr:hypothetical protein [Asgard group archaeon]
MGLRIYSNRINLPNREIYIAFGVERRNEQWRHILIQPYIDSLIDKRLVIKTKNENEYKCANNKFIYTIRYIFSKDDFLIAIDRPKAIVIYIGHSRWGQGPAFDPEGYINEENKCPDPQIYKDKNPWENHVRMGWDIASTACVKDILEHCTNPVGYTKKKPPHFTWYIHK